MDERKVLEKIEELGKGLPRFPDGRINYSNAPAAPVVTIFVRYKGEILILKRGDKVATYRGKWNVVAGYLDEIRPVKEKVLEELREEAGISESDILSFHFGRPLKFADKSIGKTWFVHPVLVEMKEKPRIRLDWEHTEYRWIRPEEIKNFDAVSNLAKGWKAASK